MGRARDRRPEAEAARRLDRWVAALLAGRAPAVRLRSAPEKRAAAAALRLRAGSRPAGAAPEGLRERLLALRPEGALPAPAQGRAPGRRAALVALGRGGFAVGGVLAAAGGWMLWRDLLAPGRWMPMGAMADFPAGTVRPMMAGHSFIYVIRDALGLRALGGRCTDLGCPLQYSAAAGALSCPCHGAEFDLQGRLIPSTYTWQLPPLPALPVRVRSGQVQVRAGAS